MFCFLKFQWSKILKYKMSVVYIYSWFSQTNLEKKIIPCRPGIMEWKGVVVGMPKLWEFYV